MKTGVYFCRCGGNISEKIKVDEVRRELTTGASEPHFTAIDFLCSEEGKTLLAADLRENDISRVVIAACSPRDHELTFRGVLAGAGINPFLMQMANVREQIAWVTVDEAEATAKAARHIRAALRRVSLHAPLARKEIDICPDVVVIGGGPAGLKAALTIAQAGRKAVIVEKTPVIGGLPVRYEELFPTLECGPCMLEPVLGEVLHGEHAENIELLTMAEVVELTGYYGNFILKIRQEPRYVDGSRCVGCAECIAVCPAAAPNPFNYDLNDRQAISLPFNGALPNVPYIDGAICRQLQGEECRACRDACPLEDTICFDGHAEIVTRQAGAVVVATGAGLYDSRTVPGLGYGTLPDVYSAAEIERLLAANGPTEGILAQEQDGRPESVAIIHCVGSLDAAHKEYCSGICCQYAFKFNHLLRRKLPGTRIFHLVKEVALPGKQEFFLYRQARDNEDTSFIRYADMSALRIFLENGRKIIEFLDAGGRKERIAADLVVLCPAVVPAAGTGALATVLDLPLDQWGFFEEMHSRLDAAQSKVKGIFLAGCCQAPMDIRHAMEQGMAAAGYILSGLVPGRKLEIQPITAAVDAGCCSGCRICMTSCPFKALSFDQARKVAVVNEVLCQGCGTCVAACPAGAITGHHFTTLEIISEIEELLR